MATTLRWYSPLYISKHANTDVVMLNKDAEVESNWVFWERQILIEALETWLTTEWRTYYA